VCQRAAPLPVLYRRGRLASGPGRIRARRRAADGGGVNRKIDYHDDPAAPEANSLVPAVTIVVERDDDALLLIRRTDNGNWALPGGAIEMSESVAQAAARETLEETGITRAVTGLAGIYSDPGHVIHYTSNDEVRREFAIVLTARPVSGEPTPSAESREVRWADPAGPAGYAMDRSMRKRIVDYLDGTGPHID
jgi:8-oxo-dGTP pyrophosphatase MutT (NUDIX family)